MTEAAAAPLGAFEPDCSQWRPWTPEHVAGVLAGVDTPWYVAAGWAIELFVGASYREHEDLEVAVADVDFGRFAAALSAYDLFVAGGVDGRGMVWPLDRADEAFGLHHQTWVREPATGHWLMDVFREPSRDGRWVCRRDPAITLPYDQVIARTADGIPYARPEIALLFKAKHVRPKDQHDFDVAAPLLDDDARSWLVASITRVHPGHAWLARLAAMGPVEPVSFHP